MKTYSLLLASLAPSIAFAQITITQAALPQAGDDWGIYTDNDGGTAFAITPSGPNAQTWNYANAFDNISTFGLQWATPGSIAGGAFFPGAQSAIDTDGLSAFYETTGTGLYNAGSYYSFGGGTTTEHTVNGLIMPVPFTYGGQRSFSETSTEITVFGGDPAYKSVRHVDGSFVCDAWGTIYTPAYPSGANVLRLVVTHDGAVDSSFTDASGTGNGPWVFAQVQEYPGHVDYIFTQNGAPVVIADVVEGEEASYYSASLPDGISDQGPATQSPQVYPVPSADGLVHIAIGQRGAKTLEILNAIGEVQRRITVLGTDVLHLGTEALAPGTYLFRCFNEDGAMVGHGRFIVVR
jgi:hypothetical protein